MDEVIPMRPTIKLDYVRRPASGEYIEFPDMNPEEFVRMRVFRNADNPGTGTCARCGRRAYVNIDGHWVHGGFGRYHCATD